MGVYSVVSVVTHLQNDPSTSLCIRGGKKTLTKVSEPPTKCKVLFNLLVKASEYLKPSGNFESCAG